MENFIKGAALTALFAIPSRSFTFPFSQRATLVDSTKSFRNNPFITSPTSTPFQYASIESQVYSTIADSKQSKSTSFDPSDEFTGVSPSKILGDPIPYRELTIGVLKETYPGENRVSIAPESAKMLVDAGLSVVVESGG